MPIRRQEQATHRFAVVLVFLAQARLPKRRPDSDWLTALQIISPLCCNAVVDVHSVRVEGPATQSPFFVRCLRPFSPLWFQL